MDMYIIMYLVNVLDLFSANTENKDYGSAAQTEWDVPG